MQWRTFAAELIGNGHEGTQVRERKKSCIRFILGRLSTLVIMAIRHFLFHMINCPLQVS